MAPDDVVLKRRHSSVHACSADPCCLFNGLADYCVTHCTRPWITGDGTASMDAAVRAFVRPQQGLPDCIAAAAAAACRKCSP